MRALKCGGSAHFLMRRGKLRGAAGRLIPLFPLCGDTATGQRVAAGRLIFLRGAAVLKKGIKKSFARRANDKKI